MPICKRYPVVPRSSNISHLLRVHNLFSLGRPEPHVNTLIIGDATLLLVDLRAEGEHLVVSIAFREHFVKSAGGVRVVGGHTANRSDCFLSVVGMPFAMLAVAFIIILLATEAIATIK